MPALPRPRPRALGKCRESRGLKSERIAPGDPMGPCPLPPAACSLLLVNLTSQNLCFHCEPCPRASRFLRACRPVLGTAAHGWVHPSPCRPRGLEMAPGSPRVLVRFRSRPGCPGRATGGRVFSQPGAAPLGARLWPLPGCCLPLVSLPSPSQGRPSLRLAARMPLTLPKPAPLLLRVPEAPQGPQDPPETPD